MEINPAINYQKMQSVTPCYQLYRLTPQGGASSVTLSNSGGETSVFNIPAYVFNLSRSYLAFTLTAPASGPNPDDRYSALFTLGTIACVRQIELFTRNGTRLCNIPNVTKYMQVTSLTDNPLSKLLQETGFDLDYLDPFFRTNLSGDASGNYRVGVAVGADPDLATAREQNAFNYFEQSSYLTSGADDTAFALDFRIPMSIVKNSIFDLDKDLYFGDELIQLRLTYNAGSVIGAGGTDNELTDQQDLSAPPALTGLYFYLAVEKNPQIDNSIKQQVRTNGLNVLIDYVHSYNRNFVANETSHALTYRFNRGNGRRLRKIYCIPYIGTETANSNFYNHHWNQLNDAIRSYHTTLNDQRLQQWELNVGDGDSYLVQKQYLDGSCVLGFEHYEANFFHVEVFDNMKTWERQPNMECGLPLDVEQKWDMVATADDLRLYYVYAVCQRMLTIKPDGSIALD